MGRRAQAFTTAWVTSFATGWIALTVGTGWDDSILLVHGASGLAAAVLAPWHDIARRARPALRWASSIIAAAIVVIVLTGLLHAAGLWVGRGDYAALTVHTIAGSVLAVVVTSVALVRLLRHRPRNPPPTWGRRDFLRAGAGVAGALAARGAVESLVSLADLDGAHRRFTGSFEVASFNPKALPTTNWLSDESPQVDVAAWRLTTSPGSATRRWTHAELLDAGEIVDATIDCTGAWYSTQRWFGVPLDTLLPGMSGRSIEVRSLTGYTRLFPVSDAQRLWLAVRLGGTELSRGHGFPARLVAPGRRGFWWVKWVDEIRVTDRPWWLQSPLPLQ